MDNQKSLSEGCSEDCSKLSKLLLEEESFTAYAVPNGGIKPSGFSGVAGFCYRINCSGKSLCFNKTVNF